MCNQQYGKGCHTFSRREKKVIDLKLVDHCSWTYAMRFGDNAVPGDRRRGVELPNGADDRDHWSTRQGDSVLATVTRVDTVAMVAHDDEVRREEEEDKADPTMILVRPTPRDGRRASLHNQRVTQEMTCLLFHAAPRPRYAECDEMGPRRQQRQEPLQLVEMVNDQKINGRLPPHTGHKITQVIQSRCGRRSAAEEQSDISFWVPCWVTV